jgi:hypothetical protein
LRVSDPGFETGYDQPSPDDSALFSRYSDLLADCLRQRYRESSGYRVTTEKEESKVVPRSWNVSLCRGWFAGARVTIKPIGDIPHRVMVQVLWHTKFLEALTKAFAIASLAIFLLLVVAFRGRILFALLIAFTVGLIWLMAGTVVMLLLAKLGSRIFGNEFDFNRRSEIARELKLVALPAPTANPLRPSPLATNTKV